MIKLNHQSKKMADHDCIYLNHSGFEYHFNTDRKRETLSYSDDHLHRVCRVIPGDDRNFYVLYRYRNCSASGDRFSVFLECWFGGESVFNINLGQGSPNYFIDKVIGGNNIYIVTGKIIKVNLKNLSTTVLDRKTMVGDLFRVTNDEKYLVSCDKQCSHYSLFDIDNQRHSFFNKTIKCLSTWIVNYYIVRIHDENILETLHILTHSSKYYYVPGLLKSVVLSSLDNKSIFIHSNSGSTKIDLGNGTKYGVGYVTPYLHREQLIYCDRSSKSDLYYLEAVFYASGQANFRTSYPMINLIPFIEGICFDIALILMELVSGIKNRELLVRIYHYVTSPNTKRCKDKNSFFQLFKI